MVGEVDFGTPRDVMYDVRMIDRWVCPRLLSGVPYSMELCGGVSVTLYLLHVNICNTPRCV